MAADDNREKGSQRRAGVAQVSNIEVAPGTIVVFADISCPWAHAAIYRWRAARARLGLTGALELDVRAFPLELINEESTPRRIVEAEIPVVGGMEPGAGWQVWQGPSDDWPVTTLPALEAVYAAKRQGLDVSADLDRALRLALFRDSRNISMHHEIMEVAASVPGLDTDALAELLERGEAKRAIFEDLEAARDDRVQGSPHFFLPDGTDEHNPGVTLRWEGEHGEGFPVVSKDEVSIYDSLLERAARTGPHLTGG
jgi:predicted DsbA family dithiol-disulfide isomerase